MNPFLPRWVGIVNFLFVQWFFVRIAGEFEDNVFIRYRIFRWVWPLTGWWSDYRRI